MLGARSFRNCFRLSPIFVSLAISMIPAYGQEPSAASGKTDNLGPVQASKGVISGRVLRDDGEPFIGKIVTVYPAAQNNPSIKDSSYVSVGTDGEGNFKTPEIDYGVYRVRAEVPGYVERELNDSLQKLLSGSLHRPGEFVNIVLVPGGAITGKITDKQGRPLVSVVVSATRVRDPNGIADPQLLHRFERRTDDRGIYRIYGLPSGSFTVCTSGASGNSANAREVPECYPSGPMGAAQEVAVTVGNTTANIDIRHDQRPGYSVSGKVTGLSPGGSSLNFSVFRLDSGMLVASSDYFRSDITSYAVPGLTDGDYLVQATQISASQKQGIFASSAAPRRFTVKGGSVVGVDVVFRPASGLSGKVTMAYSDPPLACSPSARPGPDSLGISLLPAIPNDYIFRQILKDFAPSFKGELVIGGIPSGKVRIGVELPGDSWYIKEFSMPVPAIKKPLRVSAAGWINLQSGTRVDDLALVVSDGAAQLSGQAAIAEVGRAFLVPVDKELVTDLSRYYEVNGYGGQFDFKNIAPGKYYLLWKSGESKEITTPEALEPANRAALLKSAIATGKEIELIPCQKKVGVKLGK